MIKKIHNIDKFSEICFYDIENRNFKIETNKNEKTDRGLFTKIGTDIYGIVESPNGPMFFHNQTTYFLSSLDYKFEFKHIYKKIGVFKLIVNGKIVEYIEYTTTPYTDFDTWSKEEDVDFFQWINQTDENIKTKNKFYVFYTR